MTQHEFVPAQPGLYAVLSGEEKLEDIKTMRIVGYDVVHLPDGEMEVFPMGATIRGAIKRIPQDRCWLFSDKELIRRPDY